MVITVNYDVVKVGAVAVGIAAIAAALTARIAV